MQAAGLTNRREFFRLAALGTASAFLAAACGQATPPAATQTPPAAKPTEAPAAAAKPTQPAAAGATPAPIGGGKFTAPAITAPAGYTPTNGKLYASEGWDKVFPKGLIEIASYQGKPWSVPVNIHRANVLWYNKQMFADVGVTDAPKTWDAFFDIGEKLKAKGQPLIGVAESSPGFWAHVTETILISQLGADGYRGLFTGTTKWDDKRVADALSFSAKALDYANKDFTSVSWGDIND